MAETIVVRIQDKGKQAPVIEVEGAPGGHNIYVGPLVNNAAVEHGALVNLLGVDAGGAIADQGWRVVDPSLPGEATRNGLSVLWLSHDHSGPFCNGDLQVGFNCVLPGHYYANPIHTKDTSLGPAKGGWLRVYADDNLVLQFKPRPHKMAKRRARVEER